MGLLNQAQSDDLIDRQASSRLHFPEVINQGNSFRKIFEIHMHRYLCLEDN